MEMRRWFNPHQPQTLQIAVLLLYFRAVVGLLLPGASLYRYWGAGVVLLASVAMVAGALGIANEKRWGYRVAVAVSLLSLMPLAVWLLDSPAVLVEINFLIAALFPVALVLLLLHPMSRQHQRVWFT